MLPKWPTEYVGGPIFCFGSANSVQIRVANSPFELLMGCRLLLHLTKQISAEGGRYITFLPGDTILQKSKSVLWTENTKFLKR